MAIAAPVPRHAKWVYVGDLVRWTTSYHIADILGHPRIPAATGIAMNIRRVTTAGLKDWSRPWEVEVLCASGALCWYPMKELKVINESG